MPRANWDDFWRDFDALCARVEGSGLPGGGDAAAGTVSAAESAAVRAAARAAAADLRDAKGWVNGLTDGWAAFREALRAAAARHDFAPEDAALLRAFDRELHRAITRR